MELHQPPYGLLERLYKWTVRESDQLKTVLKFYDMDCHQKISKPDYQKLKTMVKRVKIRNFDFEILTPEMRKLKQVQCLRVARD